MDNFEYQLRILVKFAQENLNAGAFAMYQPGFITIGYFDNKGQLNVLADTVMMGTLQNTFGFLYEQIQNKIRENAHHHDIEVTMEF
jgi:hypothetical protein